MILAFVVNLLIEILGDIPKISKKFNQKYRIVILKFAFQGIGASISYSKSLQVNFYIGSIIGGMKSKLNKYYS